MSGAVEVLVVVIKVVVGWNVVVGAVVDVCSGVEDAVWVVRDVGEAIKVVCGPVVLVCKAGGTLDVDWNAVVVVGVDKGVVDVVIREEVAVGDGVVEAEDGVGVIDVWRVWICVVDGLAVDDASLGEKVRVGVAEVVCVGVDRAVEV